MLKRLAVWESFRSTTKTSTSFVRERSATLFSSSKVPWTFRARKASCQTAIHLFRKAALLTCLSCKKTQEGCEVWWLRTSVLRRYKGNSQKSRNCFSKVSGLLRNRPQGRSSTWFLRVFNRKVRVATAIMLYLDTLDEEDVLMVFDEFEVQNSPLWISISWRRPQNFVTGKRPTTNFPPALYVTTTTHADCKQANKFVLVLGSKVLCYCC